MTPQAIIAELEAAFPAKRPYRFSPMSDSVQGDEPFWLDEDFADKDDWTVLDPAWLEQVPRGFSSALSFFTDEAICFYIPAFIKADLLDGLDKVEPVFYLVNGFDDRSFMKKIRSYKKRTWTESSLKRWSRLTRSQAAVILMYLEWRGSDDQSFGYGASVNQAINRFWKKKVKSKLPCFF